VPGGRRRIDPELHFAKAQNPRRQRAILFAFIVLNSLKNSLSLRLNNFLNNDFG
jgi:hypothetical protein